MANVALLVGATATRSGDLELVLDLQQKVYVSYDEYTLAFEVRTDNSPKRRVPLQFFRRSSGFFSTVRFPRPDGTHDCVPGIDVIADAVAEALRPEARGAAEPRTS